MASSGTEPKNSVFVSFATFSIPPFLNICTSLLQSGHTNPLIFSIIPKTFKLINFANFSALFESKIETFCGVETTKAFAPFIFCAMANVSSPVPGGKSTIKKSISFHSIPSNNSIIAVIF